MKVSLTKLANGSVQFDYDNRSIPQFLNSPTDVEVQDCLIGDSNIPGIQIQYGGGIIRIKYDDLLNINGTPKPPTLAETVQLIGAEVFKFGGGNGTGGVATTNASLLTSGTLPDSRLSDNVALKQGVTTSKALNFDFPSSVIEVEVTGVLPTDTSDARAKTNVVLTFYKDNVVLFKCNGAMAIQGQSSAFHPKKGYEIDFTNANGDALLIKWGNCHPVDAINFKAFFTDPTMTRDVSAGRFWHKIRTSRPFPSSFIADFTADESSVNKKYLYYDDSLFYPEGFPLHVKNNGQAQGLYMWRMKKKRENYRLDSANKANIFLDSDTNTGLDFTSFTPNQWDLKSPKLTGYVTAGPVADATVLNSINRFFSWIGGCLNGQVDMRSTYTDYINLDSVIDYIITGEVIHSVDINNNNTELMTWDGLRWSFCIYDQDLSVGFDKALEGVRSAPNQQVMTDPIWVKFKTVFDAELKARYTALRNSGIINMNTLQEIYSAIPRIIPTDYYIENLTLWGWSGTHWDGVDWNTSLRQILSFLSQKIVYLDSVYQSGVVQPPADGGGDPVAEGLLTVLSSPGIDLSKAPQVYTATEKVGGDNINTIIFSEHLPADTDGYIELCRNSQSEEGEDYNSKNVYFGFAESTVLINPANMTLNLKVGIFPSTDNGLLVKDNDYFFDAANGYNHTLPTQRGESSNAANRVRIKRTGSVYKLQKSMDYGSTYTDEYTFVNYSYTGALYVISGIIDGGFGGGSQLVLPKGGGLSI